MEIHEAEVLEENDESYLVLKLAEGSLKIPITKDVPKDVQSVFNQLIIALKKGAFQFSLKEVDDGDIIYHVAKEYISQLNSELKDVYQEMVEYQIIENEADQ